ncbi:MAG: NADPH:quinone reductase [Sinobacteraceae bacterium]|nr:NADPH:quinone reductase [Nevskiaceae bacterium]
MEVIRVGEQPTPQPARGEVRVRVHFSGVNPSDVKARAGTRGAPPYPLIIPHSDGAGVIDALGADVAAERLGQRVWIWNAAWRRPYGSCAQYVCLPAQQAVPLPEHTPFEAGACFGIPAMTACHATLGDGPVAGQTVLVTGGAGAVGHYAIQFARWSGAMVITTVSSEAKARHAHAAGADHVINYRTEDVVTRVRELTHDEGVDRIVEVEFGGNLEVSRQVLKSGGTIAAYGSTAQPTPTLPFYPLLFKHTTVHMLLVYVLTTAQRARACELISRALAEDRLRHAIAQCFPLADTAQAHLAVESGRATGNVLVTID